MELQELKESILKNNIPDILIFSGLETTLKNIYIEEISNRLRLKKTYIDAEQLFTQKSNSFIFEPKLLILINPKLDDKHIEILSKMKHIIICVDNIDKRARLFKDFSKETIEFNPMDNNTLTSILLHKYELDETQIEWIIDACSNDYGKCLNELDKLKVFRQDIKIKENQRDMFTHLMELSVFHQDITDKVYQFIDAISFRNISETWRLYSDVTILGHSGIELLALIYSRMRMILLVQMINSPTPDSVGLTTFQINIAKKFLHCYTDVELLSIISTIKEIDTKIKLGEIEEDMSVSYLLSLIL